MILITSFITIALVYYFHEPGVPYAFFVAICMEAAFVLYIFNYLKEMENNFTMKNDNNQKNFEKKESQLLEELNSVNEELSALKKANMEGEMLEIIKRQQEDLPGNQET